MFNEFHIQMNPSNENTIIRNYEYKTQVTGFNWFFLGQISQWYNAPSMIKRLKTTNMVGFNYWTLYNSATREYVGFLNQEE